MRLPTVARLLALLGMLAVPAPSGAQDLVERVRAATGSKPKPAAKPPAKSKAKSKPRPKPKAKPKAKPRAAARKPSSKPVTKGATAPAAPAAVVPVEPEPEAPPAASSTPPADSSAKSTSPVPATPPSTTAAPAGTAAPSTASPAAPGSTPPVPAAPGEAAPAEPTTTTPAEAVAPKAPPEPERGDSAEAAPSAALQLALFADAYATWQSSGTRTLATLSNHRAFSGQGSNGRAENGFGLAFLGLDVSYVAPHVGATANVRLGPGAPIYHAQPSGESDAAFGVDLLTQAYLTWRPWQPLTLDLGMFNTPFGAEVLESWKNLSYTRGALYYYAQPAWHSGLRAQWDASEQLSLVGFIANGSNIISETQQNEGASQLPTLGLQLGWTPSEALWLAAGGLFASDGNDNEDAGFDALGDVVLRLELGRLQALLNADYVLTRGGAPDGSDRHFFGASAAVGYAFSELFGAAVRGEWLLDDASYDEGEHQRWRLFTVTLTADVKPIAAAPYLILRWDNRWEESNQQVFGKDARGTAEPEDDSYADVWFQSVLGVVVTTAP